MKCFRILRASELLAEGVVWTDNTVTTYNPANGAKTQWVNVGRVMLTQAAGVALIWIDTEHEPIHSPAPEPSTGKALGGGEDLFTEFGPSVGTVGHFDPNHPHLEQRVEVNEMWRGPCACAAVSCHAHGLAACHRRARDFKLRGWPDSIALCEACMPKDIGAPKDVSGSTPEAVSTGPGSQPGMASGARAQSEHRREEPPPTTFVSASCKGEYCSVCRKPAEAKLAEEIMWDDPNPDRYNLTAYVCREHFEMVVLPYARRAREVDRVAKAVDKAPQFRFDLTKIAEASLLELYDAMAELARKRDMGKPPGEPRLCQSRHPDGTRCFLGAGHTLAHIGNRSGTRVLWTDGRERKKPSAYIRELADKILGPVETNDFDELERSDRVRLRAEVNAIIAYLDTEHQ